MHRIWRRYGPIKILRQLSGDRSKRKIEGKTEGGFGSVGLRSICSDERLIDKVLVLSRKVFYNVDV